MFASRPATMLASRRSTLLPFTIILVVFFITFHLLGSSTRDRVTSLREWSSSGEIYISDGLPREPTPSGSQRNETVADSPSDQRNKTGKKESQKDEKCASDLARHSKTLPSLNRTFHVDDKIVYDPAGPKPSQIVILTATDGGGHNNEIEDILGRAEANRREYCDHQGYQYHFVNVSKYDLDGAHPVWKKLPAIVETFNTYPDAQWIWMLDLDAIVMTPSVDLRELILSEAGMRKNLLTGHEYHHSNRKGLGVYSPQDVDFQNVDFLISQDHNGVNAGSFMIRRSKFSQLLLDMWADPFFMRMTWAGQEQDTILHFVRHHPAFRQHTGLMKQRVINSFVEGGDTMAWQEGDLLVHLAGCWTNHKCGEKWEEYWSQRETASSLREDSSTEDEIVAQQS